MKKGEFCNLVIVLLRIYFLRELSMYLRRLVICLFILLPTTIVSYKNDKFCEPRSCPQTAACQEIKQADLPYIISQPGHYCVNTNLTYIGTGAAISIINVENVKLTFNTATLTLTNASATGISVLNATEVTIEGDSIKNIAVTPTGYGIDIQQSDAVTLNNLVLISHFDGLHIISSTTVAAKNLSIERCGNTGAFVQTSKNINFEQVAFNANAIGLHFYGDATTTPNKDCTVSNGTFLNSTGTHSLFAQQIIGLLVDNCSCSLDALNVAVTLAQFGDTSNASLIAHDVIIQNSIFAHSVSATGLRFQQARRFTLDTVVVSTGGFFNNMSVVDSEQGVIIHGECSGSIDVVNSSFISLIENVIGRSLSLNGSTTGKNCNSNTVSKNTIKSSLFLNGSDSGNCNSNFISENTLLFLSLSGFNLGNCNDNFVSENTATQGIGLSGDSNGNCLRNTISKNNVGSNVSLSGSSSGNCNGNAVSQNTIRFGISLSGFSGNCNSNSVSQNTTSDVGLSGLSGNCNSNSVSQNTTSGGISLDGTISGNCNRNTISENAVGTSIILFGADGNCDNNDIRNNSGYFIFTASDSDKNVVADNMLNTITLDNACSSNIVINNYFNTVGTSFGAGVNTTAPNFPYP
jgi:hypothetical protein